MRSIQAFAIDPTTGALTAVPGSPFATEPGPPSALIDSSGTYLYTTNFDSNTISAYTINGTTGALTLVNTVPTGTSPRLAELIELQ